MTEPKDISGIESPMVSTESAESKSGGSNTSAGGASRPRNVAVRVFRALWRNTDNATKWIQVFALVFAAIWTFQKFRQTEAPGLETSAGFSVQLDLKYHQAPGAVSGYCRVYATFEIANSGVKSFDVASTRLRAWRISVPVQSDKPLFVDIRSLENRNKPFADINVPDMALARHYVPKSEAYSGYQWNFYGPPSTDLFIGDIEAYDKSGRLLGKAFNWNEICG